MNLTWTDIHEGLKNQSQFCEGYSDLYHALFGILANLTDPHRPPKGHTPEVEALTRLVESNWQGRILTGWVEGTLLLAAGIHAAVLSDDPAAAGLRPFYATVNGAFHLDKDQPALQDAVFDLLRNRGKVLPWFLREGRVQTNETSRSIAWLLPAHILTGWQPDLTITLVDLGTSAGLNLSADFQNWHWTIDGRAFTIGQEPWLAEQLVSSEGSPLDTNKLISPTIHQRMGFDLHPLDLQNEQHYLMLRACLWGDQPERYRRFEMAAEGFRRMMAAGQLSHLFQADIIDAVQSLPERVERGVPYPHLLLVFNSAVTVYFPDSSYDTLRTNLLESFQRLPSGVTGLWLEHESPRRDENVQRGKHFLLRAHTADGSRFHLGELEAHPTHLYLNSGWDALREKLDF